MLTDAEYKAYLLEFRAATLERKQGYADVYDAGLGANERVADDSRDQVAPESCRRCSRPELRGDEANLGRDVAGVAVVVRLDGPGHTDAGKVSFVESTVSFDAFLLVTDIVDRGVFSPLGDDHSHAKSTV